MTIKEYYELDDNKKIKFFYDDNKELWKRFPIVSRHIVIHLAYSEVALKKYMLKINNTSHNQLMKNNPDDWVCKRRADYIVFLYKEISKKQHNKISKKKLKKLWNETYETLVEENKIITKIKKDLKDKYEEENKIFNKEKVFDSIKYIKDNDTLTEEEKKQYIKDLILSIKKGKNNREQYEKQKKMQDAYKKFQSGNNTKENMDNLADILKNNNTTSKNEVGVFEEIPTYKSNDKEYYNNLENFLDDKLNNYINNNTDISNNINNYQLNDKIDISYLDNLENLDNLDNLENLENLDNLET